MPYLACYCDSNMLADDMYALRWAVDPTLIDPPDDLGDLGPGYALVWFEDGDVPESICILDHAGLEAREAEAANRAVARQDVADAEVRA